MFTVYVLRSDRDGRLYTGVTGDLQRRLREHQSGKVASTRHRRPLRLVYREAYDTKSEALSRERYFKTPEGGQVRHRLVEEAELTRRSG